MNRTLMRRIENLTLRLNPIGISRTIRLFSVGNFSIMWILFQPSMKSNARPGLGRSGTIWLIFCGALAHVNAFGLEKNGFDLTNSAIPREAILFGGSPKDEIPALSQPKFTKPNQAAFLHDD